MAYCKLYDKTGDSPDVKNGFRVLCVILREFFGTVKLIKFQQ